MLKYNFFKSNVYDYFSIIRNAFVFLFPIYVVSSFVILFAVFLKLLGYTVYSETMLRLYDTIGLILPPILTLCIAYFFVMRYKMPKLPVAIAVSVFFEILIVFFKDHGAMILYFVACVLPFIVVPVLNFFYLQRWSKFMSHSNLNESLLESFNLLLPVVLVTIILLGLSTSLVYFVDLFDLHLLNIVSFGSTDIGEYIFALLNSILWWFGLHGGMFLGGLIDVIAQTTNTPKVEVGNILNAFVFIGGSGATISLIIAILLVSKEKNYKFVSIAGLPFALLNINEIVVFGLPILFNPTLLIPFILTPIANVFIVNVALDLNLITISSYELSFSTFMFFNAWIGTNEGMAGVFVQIFSIAVGTLIYVPFVLKLNENQESIRFETFNSQFANQTDEVIFKLDDTVKQNAANEFRNKEIIKNLARVSKYIFILHYQPQVCPHTNRITGCESLIRAINSEGKLVLPFDFLPWFDKANMNKSIDMWVLEEAYRQSLIFKKLGIDAPISVNISGNLLDDDEFIEFTTNIIKKASGGINIELTEKLLANNDNMVTLLKQIQRAGAKNYIDDFGTEYSSLSYLYKLPIDAIKVDRGFVLALDDKKGQDVMDGILLLAKTMKYKVVVEGVETNEQLEFVMQHDNLSIQGWYYSKALSGDDFISYYNSFYHQNS